MRYLVGIDLGTTNSAVSYFDTYEKKGVQELSLSQITEEGVVKDRPILPSFCYLTSSAEKSTKPLSWTHYDKSILVGEYARQQGALIPTRVIESAKSWLCHGAAHRNDRILPIDADDASRRMSPKEAISFYLSHIRDVWNKKMAKKDPANSLQEQHVVLTVPASFDEVARRLTAEVAKRVGMKELTLLEEPLAAFYYWLSEQREEDLSCFKEGDEIVICDVGGGTTDFSIIEVKREDDSFSFERKAVGDHLLLGGDNMDAALAHFVEKKIGTDSAIGDWHRLRFEARKLKETFLSELAPESKSVFLAGAGSSIIGGSLQVEVSKDEVEQFLLNGFFPNLPLLEAINLSKGGGVQKMGLPYEPDPAITKHLANFLKRHTKKGPDYILFNGAAMTPSLFKQRVMECIGVWYTDKNCTCLEANALDLAVSKGATFYARARLGEGRKVKAGAARAYFIEVEVEGETKGLTLLKRGSEENDKQELSHTFYVKPNRPISFRLYSSNVRLGDEVETFVSIDPEELQLLPPIHTLLRFGKKEKQEELLPVHIVRELTAVGTLDLTLKSVSTDHEWLLTFEVRSGTGEEVTRQLSNAELKGQIVSNALTNQAKEVILSSFCEGDPEPKKILSTIEEMIEIPRNEWSLSFIRSLWDPLLEVASKRVRAPSYEARWWNIVGFVLRPGFGYPLDGERMKDLWKILLADRSVSLKTDVMNQKWICLRRVAGGLNKGQQIQLASDWVRALFDERGNLKQPKKNEQYPYSEKIRALAAMELLDTKWKIKVGNEVVKRISRGNSLEAERWALGRFGARHLLYGTPVDVIPKEAVTKWVEKLLAVSLPGEEAEPLFMQLARKTSLRETKLSDETIQKIKDTYPHLNKLNDTLDNFIEREMKEQEAFFGDTLPTGLILKN